MLICGLAQEHQDVHAVLYSPSMSGDYRSYFSGYANISTRQPSGWDRRVPNLWRGFGIGMHLTGDKVKLYHGLSHELPHGIPKGIKKVVTMHDLIVWRYPQYFKHFDRVVHRIKQRHSCKIADVVVAISEQTKRDLIDIMHVPEEKIRVLYQSCDQIFWQPIPEDDKKDIKALYHLPEKYFVCVGTIEERKNQISAVKALKELPEDVHLVIVGRPHTHYYFELQRTIRELELNDRVHIIQKADFEDFPGLYANAVGSVYVSRFEGFGIPILESMCCDIPVITSNCSSMPEAGGEAALYVNPEDPKDIAAKMRMLLNQPTLREELIAKGRVQREKYTQHAVIEQFYSLYSELLDKDNDSEEN
ncbi:MAG: glycosyltransferase family 4 protein [Bacteroidales bacterium]|nr:glycosyltransferase family 4 protein [Bacteroidales bacterium]